MERRRDLHGPRLFPPRSQSRSRRYVLLPQPFRSSLIRSYRDPPRNTTNESFTVLSKLNIINDRIAEDKEDFDLNYFPTALTRQSTNTGMTSADSSTSSVSLTRSSTRTSIVDSIWNRKSSSVNVNNTGQGTEPWPALSRSTTWRSDRADSVVGGAIEEEGSYSLSSPPSKILGWACDVV